MDELFIGLGIQLFLGLCSTSFKTVPLELPLAICSYHPGALIDSLWLAPARGWVVATDTLGMGDLELTQNYALQPC